MATKLRISVAEMTDIAPIAAHMRAADVAEVLASSGHTPDQALLSSWLGSKWTYTISDDLGPVAMFGVSSWEDGVGCPWMLAVDRLTGDHPLEFLRGARRVMERMKVEFTSLENYVDARNVVSIRWLTWLGFTIHPAAPHGVARLPFHRFTWRS